jgi:hypothetical protein
MDGAYRLNEPLVACEPMDGELILLHFESGLYYNVRGTGAAICHHLMAGGAVAEAVRTLAAHYGLPVERVEREVRVFVEQLAKEELLVPSESPRDGRRMDQPTGDYTVPCCERFDDMADQLLLDKIDDLTQDAQWSAPPPVPSP